MLRTVVAAALAVGAAFTVMPTSAVAQGLVPCAPEGGFCRVPYPTRVVYGIPGRTTAREVGGRGIPCSNEVFGDPAPGIPKRCAYIERRFDRDGGWGPDRGRPGPDFDRPRRDFRGPDWRDDRAAAWQFCARENDFCDFRGTRRVRYGAGRRFVERVSRDGIPCNNRAFGDPAPGVLKVCQVLD
ncbi:hypothetical protein ACFOYU_08275 [Microvirga sp. GCM10011540]|uniref:hypothetical protein n=1 Tax=Microvirga sp. GCM10011540 TaxID=3317338 RepID=UPI00360970F2